MENFGLIVEENNNFGHNDIIWKGDLNFPHRDQEKNFDKENEILKKYKEKKIIQENNSLFELTRIGINKLNKPNETDGPTSCQALFIPNDKLLSIDFNIWTLKYFRNQLRFILAFNYYFPEGNLRFYFDHYMIKRFEQLEDIDSLNITKVFEKIEYNDYEEDRQKSVRIFITQFLEEAKKYEDIQFENSLIRFIFYYSLASSCYFNKIESKLEIRDKTADFFIYKFNHPSFLENVGKDNEGVITNGFLGQLVRFLVLKQSEYKYNGKTIKVAKHLLWRDAHNNCLAYNDYEMINELNKIINTRDIDIEKIYLLPAGSTYKAPWNGKAICNVDSTLVTRSAVAGWIQAINKTGESWFDDETYLSTIGMAFIINQNTNELILKNHVPTSNHQGIKIEEYDYGIDEFVLTSFFKVREIIKNSVYLEHQYIDKHFIIFCYDVNNTNNEKERYIHKAQLILIYYLLQKNLINSKTTFRNLFKEIEKLRSNPRFQFENDEKKVMRLILAIFPSKYILMNTLQAPDNNKIDQEIDLNFLLENRIKKYITDKNINPNIPIVSLEMLKELKIDCYKNIIINSLEWCKDPYLTNYINKFDCDPSEYLSGFYYEKPPILDLGFIRQPSDIKHAINMMIENQLRLPLNKSDYKLATETDIILKNMNNNKFNKNGIFNDKIINQIIGDKDDIIEFININFQENIILSKLIWKSLNYYGYDIPPEWFKSNDQERHNIKNFNIKVKEKGNNKMWVNNTMILLFGEEQHDIFLMSEKWKKKYLKYKQKYITLKKNQFNI